MFGTVLSHYFQCSEAKSVVNYCLSLCVWNYLVQQCAISVKYSLEKLAKVQMWAGWKRCKNFSTFGPDYIIDGQRIHIPKVLMRWNRSLWVMAEADSIFQIPNCAHIQ